MSCYEGEGARAGALADGICSDLCRMYAFKDLDGRIDVGLVAEGFLLV